MVGSKISQSDHCLGDEQFYFRIDGDFYEGTSDDDDEDEEDEENE